MNTKKMKKMKTIKDKNKNTKKVIRLIKYKKAYMRQLCTVFLNRLYMLVSFFWDY